MDSDKNNQILQVARMYYIDRIPQNKISQIIGLSKPTVSRLIKKAQELGYVKIQIEQPQALTSNLENVLKKKYNLKSVTVIPNSMEETDKVIDKLNQTLLDDLKHLVISNSIIGITWNSVLSNLIDILESQTPEIKTNVRVVQLNGSITPLVHKKNSTELLYALAKMFGAKAYQICSPVYVEQKKIARLIKNESEIKKLLDMAARSDIAILAPEMIQKDDLLIESGFKLSELEEVKENGAIGVLCGHILNKRGKVVNASLDQRIIGLNINTIKKIPNKIFIAYNKDDFDIVNAIMNQRLVDRLYITSDLAYLLQ